MSYVAKIDKWGNEIWQLKDWHKANQEQGFATKFKSLEQIIEAELDAEEAKRRCTTVPNVDRPATAQGTLKTTTPENRPAIASTTSVTTVTDTGPNRTGTRKTDQCTDALTAENGVIAQMGKESISMPSSTVSTPPIAMPHQTERPTRSNHMATTPAVIDITPLEQSFLPERQDMNVKLEIMSGITPELIRAKTLADNLLDQGEAEEWAQHISDVDTEAKRFLDAFKADPKFNEQRRLIKALKDNFDDLCDRITGPATAIRLQCQKLSQARLWAVYQRAEQERRALEAEQQRIAERERAEEVARLKDAAEAKAREAARQDDGSSAKADAEAEAMLLANEAKDMAQAPVVPAAVPVAAFQPPKTGVSGTPVFYHSIKDWRSFCTMIAGLVPSITANENTTTVVLPGFQMVINFTKLKKSKAPLTGMQVREGMETRNVRR